ncbi:hypothetical protein J6590_105568, partial [Homalodisca vitripennis]
MPSNFDPTDWDFYKHQKIKETGKYQSRKLAGCKACLVMKTPCGINTQIKSEATKYRNVPDARGCQRPRGIKDQMVPDAVHSQRMDTARSLELSKVYNRQKRRLNHDLPKVGHTFQVV